MVEKLDVVFWVQIVLIIVFVVAGSVIFKHAVISYGKPLTFHGLLDVGFWRNFILSPLVILAVGFLAISRLLWALPLSTTGLGRVMMILAPLSLIAIAVASAIFFGERFDMKTLIGVALVIIGVALIGGGV